MRKNLIFLTLLISVLMVSVVSASITGYLVRGRTLATDGYKATLQKVEGTTAIVSVATPSGTTEIVRVPEGENVQVGSAEISASALTQGNLFRRGGADVKIDVAPSETGVGASAGGVSEVHAHLINFANTNTGHSNINTGSFTRSTFVVSAEINCANWEYPVNAGFMLATGNISGSTQLPLFQSFYPTQDGYYISFIDPGYVINPGNSIAYVYCAEVEQAVNEKTAHFPF